MNILTFDVGNNCGWACVETTTADTGPAEHRVTVHYTEHGVESFKPARGESQGMRYMKFRHWLKKMLVDTRPDLVVYERPKGLRGTAAQEILWGMVTRIMEECDQHGINYTAVSPSELKRWATGKGNANKERMLAAARLRYPSEVVGDHNEADAMLILAWAREKYGEDKA